MTNSINDFLLYSKSCRTRGFVGVLLANFHHFSFADAMPTNQHEKSQKIRKRMEFLLRKSTIQPHSQSVLDNIFIIIVLLWRSKFTLCEKSNFCPKSRFWLTLNHLIHICKTQPTLICREVFHGKKSRLWPIINVLKMLLLSLEWILGKIFDFWNCVRLMNWEDWHKIRSVVRN